MSSRKAEEATHFVEKRTILFGECDPAGILYTPRICEYIVEGAIRFLSRSLGEPFERYMFAKRLMAPARGLNVDFMRPLTWDDEIEVRAELVEMRTHAYTVRITATNSAAEVAFSGTVTQVCIDNKTKKITPVPGKFRRALLRDTS